jgi:hypothetical protein
MASGFQAVQFQEARVLRLQPGDVLVMSVNHQLSDRETAELRQQANVLFPDHEVLVLGPDVNVTVARGGA